MHYLVLPLSASAKAMPSTLRESEFNKRQYGKCCFLREVAVLVMYHKKPVVMIGAPV